MRVRLRTVAWAAALGFVAFLLWPSPDGRDGKKAATSGAEIRSADSSHQAQRDAPVPEPDQHIVPVTQRLKAHVREYSVDALAAHERTTHAAPAAKATTATVHPTSPAPSAREFTLKNPLITITLRQYRSSADGQDRLVMAGVQNLRGEKPREFPILPDLFLLGIQEYPIINSTQQCHLQSIHALVHADLAYGEAKTQWVNATFLCERTLQVSWSLALRPADHFYRVWLQFTTSLPSAVPLFLMMLRCASKGVETMGSVSGSPLVQHATGVFASLEHPLALNGNLQHNPSVSACVLSELPHLTAGFPSRAYSLVVGVYDSPMFLRRAFSQYMERVRAHPARSFLHYNSWFDFMSWQEPNKTAFVDRMMNEPNCIARVDALGTELVSKRGVKVDSYLWDDGWDDHASLWDFHKGFPKGFTPVSQRAHAFGSGCGVWLSPWGGYGAAKDARLRMGHEQGYEISSDGFLLSGPKYYKRFCEIALRMVRTYGVNMFKFDGVNFVGDGKGAGYATEVEAMLRLLAQLREYAEDIFINLTTGTWPSPFWLLHADSIWRGLTDLGIHGDGSLRQQWVTFRDAVVFIKVVARAPLFPIHALMLHGIVAGAVGESRYYGLDKILDMTHFRDEVWSYFGLGVFLQELYVSPDKVPGAAWDVIAEAATWARERQDMLVDSHWIGGNPGRLDVYGTAAWCPRAGMVYLRNPMNASRAITFMLQNILELPSGSPTQYRVRFAYASQGKSMNRRYSLRGKAVCDDSFFCLLTASEQYVLAIGALEVLIVDVAPA